MEKKNKVRHFELVWWRVFFQNLSPLAVNFVGCRTYYHFKVRRAVFFFSENQVRRPVSCNVPVMLGRRTLFEAKIAFNFLAILRKMYQNDAIPTLN